MVRDIVCIAITVYYFVLLARIILSLPFVPPPGRSGPYRLFFDAVRALTDPLLTPLRNVIPPVRAGMLGIDLSPIVLFVGLFVLRVAIGC